MVASVFADMGIFQSTLPARGATVTALDQRMKKLISIHAPRTGSDATTSRKRRTQ